MQALIDLGAVDCILTGTFGSFNVRNYGSNNASITVESIDNNLYQEQVGAFGDMLINKSYKARNMNLKINVMRNSFYYAKLKEIIALELTGAATIFAVIVKDNNSKELFAAAECVMKTNPASMWGSNPEDNVEFHILMPSVVYTAPTVA
jgi:hypothetical protein